MNRILVTFGVMLTAFASYAARLPQAVIPSHYALTITPDLAAETFHGEETIDVDVKEPAASITMHGIGFTFPHVEVISSGKTVPATVSTASDEMITLSTTEPIAAGPAAIRISFDGKINRQLRGLYLSRTAKRKYAVTQFEATDARRAFPSFDEPAMKATFDITLVVDNGDTAIANTPIVSDTPAGEGEGKHAIRFATTPRMSTYLVALLVGDFQCIEGGVDGTPIRVCGTPGRPQLGQFALEAAEAEVHFYNGYYGIKFPFPKLDLIGIPDFEAGAMENAGAITFRETALWIDPRTASAERRRGVASTVAHEIAHQWFGDLVTMKWWDDIWLNEGFATFMTRKPLDAWKPEWHTELDDPGATIGSLTIDAQRSTRAIRTQAETSAEINQLFDGIAYGKTAAVLRMVEQWLGEETFRDGIRAYLRKYSWSNAAAEDFWSSMAASSGQPVDVVMKSFVDQPGAPLLHTLDSCEGGERSIELAQERLVPRGESSSQTWNIPVCARRVGSATGEPCMMITAQTAQLKMSGCDRPFLLSRDGRGTFAVDYSPAERQALRGRLRDLTPAELISFSANEWLLVRQLRRDIADYLALVAVIPRPAERHIVQQIADNLQFLDRRLVTDALRPAWKRRVRELLRGYAQPTWQSTGKESDDQRLARGAVLTALGRIAGDQEVIAGARRMTKQYISDPASVDATIAGDALAIAAMNGDRLLFDQLVSEYDRAQLPELKSRYLNALTAFRDPKLIARAIDFAFSDAVRSQDLPRFLGALMNNPAARPAAWSAIKSHWDDLKRVIPTAMGSMTGSVSGFCDPAAKSDVEAFFRTHSPAGGERNLRRALESIDTCIAFRAAQQESFASAIRAK